MGKGASGGPQTSEVVQTNLPEYAEPYYKRMMGRAEAESNRPYEGYPGARLADFSPDTQQSFQNVRGLGTPTGFEAAETAFTQGTGYESGYDQSQFGGGFFGSGAAQHYMNPYVDQVLNRQQARMQERFAEDQLGRDTRAVEAGAFGGTRHAVGDEIARRELEQQLSDVEARELSNAYTNAQGIYTSDQARRLQAEGMTDASGQIAEQLRQAGIGLGLGSAEQLANFGQLEQQLSLQRSGALSDQGAQQQALDQASADIGYGDFLNQRDFERQNVQFLSGTLQGVPVSPSSETFVQPPSSLSQALGLGIAGLNLANLAG
jgi:hypothetical protein